MDNREEETVEIHRPKSEIEANIIRDVLKQQGIESGFMSNWSSWLDGVFVTVKGIGSIFVFKKDADMAKAIISEYLTSIKEDSYFAGDDEQAPCDS